MGLFKKLFKPVSKVLDKIVPNELKPFLPYASAALPFLMPAGATGSFMNSMMGRALLSGGANLGSQLAQEGNEGDFDLMSTLMAGGIGALSAPGAAAKLRGMQAQPYGVDRSMSFLDKTKNFGLGALEKGANFIGDAQTTLKTPGFNMDTLKAASVPFIQGTGEVMKYEANSAMKAYEDALAAYDLEQGQFGNDTGRREAILAAMRAYNHPEELIESTLEELGLRDGGIVGLKHGGRIGFKWGGPGGKSPGTSANYGQSSSSGGGWSPSVGRNKKGYLGNHPSGGTTSGGTGTAGTTWSPSVGRTNTGYLSGPTNMNIGNLIKTGLVEDDISNLYADVSQSDINVLTSTGGLTSTTDPADVRERIGWTGQTLNPTITDEEITDVLGGTITEPTGQFAAKGGRVGYNSGGITDIFAETSFVKPDFGGVEQAIGNIEQENELLANRQQDFYMLLEEAMNNGDQDKILEIQSDFYKEFGIPMPMSENITEESVTQMAAQGGLMSYNTGGSVLPNGVEIDYRGGGFIPVGSKERADDVPARVSKNEFVMTADAVRAAGGGSVNQGAKKMYNLMNNLEARA